jgi:hypothetical protein
MNSFFYECQGYTYGYISNINLLNDSDLKAKQPESLKISLKPHQLTALYKMQELEKTNQIIFKYENNLKYVLDTNIGILGDEVGYGKTITALSILENQLNKDTISQYSQCTQNTILKIYSSIDYSNINLIIVPHNIFFQWEKSILEYTTYEFYFISKKKDIVNYKSNLKNNILISSTNLKNFIKEYKIQNINRLLIDEVDTINIPNMPHINSKFTWFITGTPKLNRVKYPRNTGFIKNIFLNFTDIEFNLCVVKNNVEYIKKSFNIEDYEEKFYKCIPTFNTEGLKNIVSKTILEMINANNYSGAIELLGGNIDNQDDIIDLVSFDIKKKINNKEKKIIYINSLHISDIEKKEKINTINKELESLNIQLESIKERLSNIDKDNCSICLDKFNDPVTLECTHTFCSFCFLQCIAHSIHNRCPTCRKPINLDKILKLNNNPKNKNILTKNKTIIKILEENKGKKFIIFSNYYNSFMLLKDEINQKLEMSFRILKGNSVSIANYIELFNNGKIDILFLNSKDSGAGIDLSNATDLILYHKLSSLDEKQVVGRAQRIGRKNILTVHKLFNINE